MPDSLDEQAAKTIRRLLHDDWTPSNTAGYDPTLDPADDANALPIHFGNYVSRLPDPQISITQPQGEFTHGGRWTGKNSATGEMNQFREGMVLVQVWAASGETYNSETTQSILARIREEVERVVDGHRLGPESGNNSGVIWSFSTEWNGRFPDATEDDTDPAWQSQVTVIYQWERTS